jgi:hypothetical protein
MTLSIQFIADARSFTYPLPPPTAHRLTTLQTALDKWAQAFTLFLLPHTLPYSPPHSQPRPELRAATTLRILNIVTRTWVSGASEPTEAVFDQHTDAFAEVVRLAATITRLDGGADEIGNMTTVPVVVAGQRSGVLKCERQSGSGSGRVTEISTSTFAFEMGMIPPLYFTAMKCRVPSLRRAAIALLEQTMPRREGIWIADLYIAVSRRLIEIEEEGLESLGVELCDGGGRLGETAKGETVPREERRVLDLFIQARSEEELEARVQRVTFELRPAGVGGELVSREEVVKW